MSNDNSDQIDYWNGPAGAKWVAAQRRLDRMLAPVSAALLARAAAREGERVIDVGCGCGDTSLALAGAGAAVWGIDISEPMLALARQRAASAGLDHLAFSRTDAATQTFTPDHQLVFSRFGVMFFADPVAAFVNLRSALSADGRLCFVCWQSPRSNPWVALAGKAVQPFLPEPDAPPDPTAPGPFAFAERDYVHAVLERAGFSQIEIEDFQPTLHLADSLDDAMTFLTDIGPLARAIEELQGETRDAALNAARDALSVHCTPTGLDLGAACWLVSARHA